MESAKPPQLFKQNLYKQLKHVSKIGSHILGSNDLFYIINYCSDSIDGSIYDNIRIYTYYYGEQSLLFDTVYYDSDK